MTLEPPEPLAALLHGARDTIDPREFHERLRADPQLEASLAWCHRTGVPLSVFLGRVVEPGASMFTDDDRTLALAYANHAAELCSGCGLHPLDHEHEREQPYLPEPRWCWSCATLESVAEDMPAERRERRGLRWLWRENRGGGG